MVDDDNFDRLSAHHWQAHTSPHRNTVYARRSENREGKSIYVYMHVEVCGYRKPDHRDGNGCNNQRNNLRPATGSQNGAHRGKRCDNTSGFKGVWFDRNLKVNPWRAWIMSKGKGKHLGQSATAEGAARMYDQAAIELFGEFAVLNFPPSA